MTKLKERIIEWGMHMETKQDLGKAWPRMYDRKIVQYWIIADGADQNAQIMHPDVV